MPRSRDELALLVETVTDRVVFILEDDGTIVDWLRGAERVTGWTSDDMLGRSLDRLYSVAEVEAGKPGDDLRAAEREGGLRERRWCRRKDGELYLADVRMIALRDADGGTRGIGAVYQDITEQTERERAIAQSEAHLRSILATVPDGMVVMDEQGAILSFSAAAETLFGYAEAEVVGRHVGLLAADGDRHWHDRDGGRHRLAGKRRVAGGGRSATGRRRDGSTFPVELIVGEARTATHRVFTGFVRDLTERERNRRRRRELQSGLTHMSRLSAMGTMAATLAHELNQPLTAISSYLETMHDLLDTGRAIDPATVLEATKGAADGALRAGAIVARLRGFVRRGEVTHADESVAQLIEDAAGLALLGSRASGIEVSVIVDEEAGCVAVDRIQIQQVLVNLLRNAVDAVEGRSVREIAISAHPDGAEAIRLIVSDSGPGIDPAIAPRLFQAFASAKKGGMGLGLSISRTIAEAHGGRVWAEPGEDGGTCFHLSLPRRGARSAA